MTKGQKTKAGHIIQMIHHGADPNRFNPNGKRVVCHNAEDYDFIEGIEFDKLSRKGAKALIANVPLEEMWTGKISGPLHYNLMDDQIFPFWIAKGVETPISVGGVPCIDTEYVRPQLDRADRAFFAIEEGKAGGGADLGCYGMFTSFKWTSKRGNKGKSRFEVGFATQAAVPRSNLTGGTAQNHKFRVVASGVAGPVGVAVGTPGAGQAKTVSLAIGLTKAQIEAAFAAEGLTVVSTGTIAMTDGKSQRIQGNGSALRVGGVDADLTTPETPAQFLARVKAANPTRSTLALGAGASITKANEADLTTGKPTFWGISDTHSGAPLFDDNPNTTFFVNYGPDWAGVDLGANPPIIKRATLRAAGATAKVTGFKVYGTNSDPNGTSFNDPDFGGSNFNPEQNGTLIGQYSGPGANKQELLMASNATAYRYVYFTRMAWDAGGNTILSEAELFAAGTPASASLPFIENASAGNTPDLPVSGAGYTFTASPPTGSDGTINVEVTSPANTLLSVAKASGQAGYMVSTTQYGSDGSILQSMLEDDPIMPGHLLLYSADTPAGLEDEANLVGQIEEWEIDDPKICMPVSHHVRVNDPERPTLPATYNSHAEEESQEDGIKLSVTMDADEGGIVEGMKALLRASGSRLVSVPRYWRIAAIHPGSPRRVFIDFYGSVGASVPVKWAGSVEQYTFVYDLLENKTAPWNFKAKTRRLA